MEFKITKIVPISPKLKRVPYCDCIVGQDPDSHQPHLIRCDNIAIYVMDREYMLVNGLVMKSKVLCCKSCLVKLIKDS